MTMTIAALDELQALRKRLAELEAIARAPRDAAAARGRIGMLERRARRAADIAHAIEVDPAWPAKLAAAELAAAEAELDYQSEYDRTFLREQRATALADVSDTSVTGEVVRRAGIVLIDRRKTTTLNAAEDRQKATAAHLRNLRKWPEDLAAEVERTQRRGYEPPPAAEPRPRAVVARRKGSDR